MTTASTVASLIVTFSLIFDYFNTKNFKESGSGLTSKQKELIIIIMLLLLYLSFGALIFSLLLPGLTFENSLYFSLTTITSCGFGNILPANTKSKIFFMFYTPVGIVLVALVITTARLTILEEFEQNYIKRRARFRQRHQEKVMQRKEQRNMRRKLKRAIMTGRRGTAFSSMVPISTQPSQPSPVKRSWKESAEGVWSSFRHWNPKDSAASFNRWRSGIGLSNGSMSRGWSRNANSNNGQGFNMTMTDFKSKPTFSSSQSSPLSVEEKEKVEDSNSNSNPNPTSDSSEQVSSQIAPASPNSPSILLHRVESPSQMTNVSHQDSSNERNDGSEHGTERDQFQDEVARMEIALQEQRTALEKDWHDYSKSIIASEKAAFWAKLVVSWSLFIIFWMVGAAVFTQTEGWNFFISLYFCFVFFTTVGLGEQV